MYAAGSPDRVRGAGRRRVRRDVRPTAPVAEQRGPGDLVGRAIPEADARHLDAGRRVVTVVEHRGHQQLPEQRRSAPVAGEQRRRGGEATTTAESQHDDPIRVDPKLGGVLGGPHEAGVAVLNRGWMLVLGREPVLHRHDRGAELRREVEQPRQAATVVAEDHAAAVDVVEGGHRRRRARRTADQQGDVGVAGRTGHQPLLERERAAAAEVVVGGPLEPHRISQRRNLVDGK
jgi:hypothetical protein